jgi:HAD superfamily hydrolase (TIGR01549 family)
MNGWTILFDLDDTLVITHTIEELRDQARRGPYYVGKWQPVYDAFNHTILPHGTKELLNHLEEYELGVVTSAQRVYASKLLRHHDLNIPILSAYHDTGRRKPHPDPIVNAMEKLDAKPERTIYVGDEEEDVEAAFSAGCIPFLLDRDRTYFGTTFTKKLVRKGGRLIADWLDLAEALEYETGSKKPWDFPISWSHTFFSDVGIRKLLKRKDLEEEGYNVFFRYTYYPASSRASPNRDYSISEWLYSREYENLKEMHAEPVEFFTDKLEKLLNTSNGIVITVAPSRREGLHPSGERMIANLLCERNPSFVDGTQCIQRTKTIPRYSDYRAHQETIYVEPASRIDGKNVLIIDNITTSGGTLKACIERVGEAGAKSVIGLAIAKTRGKGE